MKEIISSCGDCYEKERKRKEERRKSVRGGQTFRLRPESVPKRELTCNANWEMIVQATGTNTKGLGPLPLGIFKGQKKASEAESRERENSDGRQVRGSQVLGFQDKELGLIWGSAVSTTSRGSPSKSPVNPGEIIREGFMMAFKLVYEGWVRL